MNNIFLMNMQAVMSQPKLQIIDIEKKHSKTRLHKNSTAKKIIEYLFEHGKSSGEEIIKALSIKHSPKAYIQPHLRAGRIISENVNQFKNNYWINPSLVKNDFNLDDDGA